MPVLLKHGRIAGGFYLEFVINGRQYKPSQRVDPAKIVFLIFAKYDDGWKPLDRLDYRDRETAEQAFANNYKKSHFKLQLMATVEGAEPFEIARNY